MTTRILLAPLLAAATFAAACGGSEPATTTGQPAPARSAETVVNMAGSSFAPATTNLKAGESVTFVNDDGIAHNVTGDGLDSGTLEAGAKFSFTAEGPGEISYVCTFHPGMAGTLTVT